LLGQALGHFGMRYRPLVLDQLSSNRLSSERISSHSIDSILVAIYLHVIMSSSFNASSSAGAKAALALC
jgi:hypothetical protein